MTISMVSRLAPMLPVQVIGIPLKTLASYGVLVASLAVWPGWIERHFNSLLETAGKLLVRHA
jgi:flagellar biosynthetic protein FliR